MKYVLITLLGLPIITIVFCFKMELDRTSHALCIDKGGVTYEGDVRDVKAIGGIIAFTTLKSNTRVVLLSGSCGFKELK